MRDNSARNLAPGHVAHARLALPALLDHAVGLCFDEIEHGVAADIYEAVRAEQSLDLLARAAAEKRQLIADLRVFGARPGILSLMRQESRVELPVDDGQPPARPHHAYPFVDRCLRVRQGPQHMAADDKIEAAGGKRQLLCVAFLEANRR